MIIETFDLSWFKECNTLNKISDKHVSGQVTIIGGSKLFHGAPIMALKGSSRIAGMVYFSTPDEDKGVADKIKSSISSFVWVPYDEIGNYISKSESILIGPGMMRSHIREQNFVCDSEGAKTKDLCVSLFKKFPGKKWVIDGGALQTVSVEEMPKGSIVTPNGKEFEMLFREKMEANIEDRCEQIFRLANRYSVVILTKDEVSAVSDGKRVIRINGGNDGLVKGGVGDTIAGVIVGFLAKDNALFSVAAGSYLVKKAGEMLASKRAFMFNADDLVDMVPEAYGEAIKTLR